MKLNAHLLQTQQYAGDLGEGTVSGAVFGSANTPTSPSSSLAGNSALFQREVPYRNAFVQKIFSSKRGTYQGSTAFLYNTFFDISGTTVSYLVQPHELPTMGQVWDYLMRPRSGIEEDQTYFPGGVITKYVGDHFNDVDTSLTLETLLHLGTGTFPSGREWGHYSLTKKLYTFLSNIINDGSTTPEIQYKIFAKEYRGGNLTITSSSVVDQVAQNLYAGNSTPANDGTDIFRVRNDTTLPYKYVLLNYNNTVATNPVGIYGKLNGTDRCDDLGNYYFGGTNPFSLIDVSRYYLRRAVDGSSNYIDSHKYTDGGYRWIEGTSVGSIGFYFYAPGKAKSVVIKEPDGIGTVVGTIVHTLPATAYAILNYTSTSSFNFSLVFSSDTTGLKVWRPSVASYIFGISNTGTAAKQLSLIPGDGVTGITTYFPLPKASLMGDQARFLTNQGEETFFVTDTGAASIMKIYRGVTASNNYIRMLLSALSGSGISFALDLPSVGSYSVRRVLSTPFMDGNSEFIVTNPTAAQIVYKALNFVAGCNTDTISSYSGGVTTFPQTVKVGTATVNYLTEGVFGSIELGSYFRLDSDTSFHDIGYFSINQCLKNVTLNDPVNTLGYVISITGYYRISFDCTIENGGSGLPELMVALYTPALGELINKGCVLQAMNTHTPIHLERIVALTAGDTVKIKTAMSNWAAGKVAKFRPSNLDAYFTIQMVREGTTL